MSVSGEQLVAGGKHVSRSAPQNKVTATRWEAQVEKVLLLLPEDSVLKTVRRVQKCETKMATEVMVWMKPHKAKSRSSLIQAPVQDKVRRGGVSQEKMADDIGATKWPPECEADMDR